MKRSVVSAMILIGCSGEPAPAAAPAAVTPPSAAATAPPSAGGLADDFVVASWNGGQVTYGELRTKTSDQLRAMETEYQLNRYETQSQALDQLVIQALLEAEAKRQGKADIDALLRAEIEEKVAPPSDQEVTEFYPVVARQLGGATLEEARPMLAQELIRRKQQEAYVAYVEKLRADASLTSGLPYPELPRVDVAVQPTDPIRGSVDAPVTVVQFAEYQCYYCMKVGPTIDRVLAEYDGKVRVVFKDYPLPSHSRAQPAAIAAHCAGDQGKYWEMNKVLLDNQQALNDSDLRAYAQQLKLDVAAWDTCVASGKFDPVVQGNIQEATRVGVSATPTFFVNGTLISGAQSFDRFKALIDRELAAKSGG